MFFYGLSFLFKMLFYGNLGVKPPKSSPSVHPFDEKFVELPLFQETFSALRNFWLRPCRPFNLCS